ncbi:lactaldehyde reductase [Enterococcus hulanensis]|uniref:Lactaldehyde reductase n=1 Tax=Enterococcus hulanensis TaxID=2559929 RepID=A0ABU3F447_9ENTE|nr:lactaldehyde reductase [Enterococcus hulanensis]MDT2601903.1 lactaldehyde reductase [Enterococcus hulanensis]MDT2611400.1 lactaldehyde reductase [Enterococcus hulanensis]MDT2618684.1 lactaldehyde reductase [Enterococcus hulanensis]MDT2629975.1 lactaldehyde reductase [Enterococcus hulanensis]MDT2657682.1 lactaldehyde reductase [Enterococcus hulanensis]
MTVNRMILNETSYFGKGAIQEVANEAKKRGFKKALVVTDKDLLKFKVATKVIAVLEEAGLAYDVYDGIVPNPTIEDVQAGVKACQEKVADYIVAIGGGSPIDTAKAIGIIMTNPDFSDVISLEGTAETKNPALPILAIPTTSGTAAEVTINYVITDAENHRKFVCVDPHDIPVVAFIDSDMMMGMPKGLCAATGMDALTHAIEGFITKGAWEMTDMLHIQAIEIISHALRDSVAGDQTGREKMALGQYIAGMGFSNVGLGLVHGMAHPLSAWYNTPHGVACATLLPLIMDYNKEFTGEKYREIAIAMGVEGAAEMPLAEVRDAAVQAVKQLGIDVGIPQSLSELGMKKEDVARIAEDAARDVCTPGNPRDVSVEEIIALYQSML